MGKRCAGFPFGYICSVFIPEHWTWCRECLERRQEAYAAGLPLHRATPVGIVLEDIEAARLLCKCGGDPTAFRHEISLLHLSWAWQQAGHIAADGDWRRFAAE